MVGRGGPRGGARARPRRSTTTRHALLLAAARQFDAHGYHGSALSDVLDESGFTKGALYFHFESKKMLAEAVIEEVTAVWRLVVDQIASRRLDPLRRLLVETDAYIGRWMHDPLVRGASRALGESGPFGERLRTWLCDWEQATEERLVDACDRGLLRPEVDPVQVGRLLLAASAGHHSLADAVGGPRDFWMRMGDTWTVLLPAVAAEEWVAAWCTSGWHDRPPPDAEVHRRSREP